MDLIYLSWQTSMLFSRSGLSKVTSVLLLLCLLFIKTAHG